MFEIFKSIFKKEEEPMEYLSCEYIQHGFNVDYDDIKICCYNCHEGGGRQILIDNYKGEKINRRRFFKEKRKMREMNKKGIILDKCRGCTVLKKRVWDNEDYISYMVFNHWTQCNCMCRYCFTNGQSEYFNKRKNFDIYPVIKDLAEAGKIRGGGEINFGGGEPVLLKEFEPLVHLLLDCGCDNIRVHSSGIQYSKAIERGLKEGKLTLIVSADSGTEETYKKIKRVDKFNIVRENLAEYAANQGGLTYHAMDRDNYKMQMKYIIYPGYNDSKEEFDKFIELTYKTGIRGLQLDIEGGYYEDNKYNIPDRIYDLLDYAIEKAKLSGMEFVGFYDRAEHMLQHKEEYRKLRENGFSR